MIGYIDSDNGYCSSFDCSSYSVDEFYQARLDFFFSIVQEVAADHAMLKKVSIVDLNKEGYTWVITRSVYNIKRYPSWPEKLDVKTWALDEKRYIAPRATQIKDEDSNVILNCASSWVIVTSDTHRPVKPGFVNNRLVTADASKLDFKGTIEEPRLGDVDVSFINTPVHKSYFDMDFNGHVNNIVYLRWILEAIEPSFLHSHQAETVDISWHKEVYWKDNIRIATAFLDERTTRSRVEIVKDDGSSILASEAQINWTDRVARYQQAHNVDF